MPIELKFIQAFLSIDSLTSINLPDFTILTGENGAGKSHLMQAIDQRAVDISDDSVLLRNIKLYPLGGLVPLDNSPSVGFGSDNFIRSLPTVISSAWQQAEMTSRSLLRQTLQNRNIEEVIRASFLSSLESQGIGRDSILKLEGRVGKLVHEMSPEEVRKNSSILFQSADPFNQSIADTFGAYYRAMEDNKYRRFLHESCGQLSEYFDDKSFSELYGPAPWDVANEILMQMGFGYEFVYKIDSPDMINNPQNRMFQVFLKSQDGQEINIGNLSSGEKTILSIANSIYLGKKWKDSVAFPQVILLDEPDAFLHPSMTRLLLEVVNNLFVKEMQLKVIMTTHSPTTIALASEESIYLMQRRGPDRIIKISQNLAISKLSVGIPTLSVKLEDRRQVFVESENDEILFSGVYEISRHKGRSGISLNFIKSGLGDRGDCSAVKHVVKSLLESGNTNVYGIIDRDESNNEPDHRHVFILGRGERYAIENFLLDPFMIGYFLLKSHWISSERLGLPSDINHISLVDASEELIQKITDGVISLLKIPDGADNSIYTCSYQNGKKANIPKWYLNMKGHNLEDMWMDKVNEFKSFSREPKIKGELVRSAYVDLPGFVPLAFSQLFDRIVGLQSS